MACDTIPERSEWDREAQRWGGDGETAQPACPGGTVQGKRLWRRKLSRVGA